MTSSFTGLQVQRARSDSVTIGLPDDDDPDHDAVRAEAEVQDKQQLELAVENVLSNGTAADFVRQLQHCFVLFGAVSRAFCSVYRPTRPTRT